jgi:hypothetical protein
MDKLNSFIRHQPSYRLVIVGILLFLLTYFGPRYIGIIPGIIGMATWIVLLGRGSWKILRRKASRHKATLVDKSMRTLGTL